MSRPPIVINSDREWAMAQMPSWCQRGDEFDDGPCEIIDDGRWLELKSKQHDLEKPSWHQFVCEEIEKFEAHYSGEFRSLDDWSSIWRKGWWPKVSARKRFPKSAPKEFHPFFRKGSAEFARAIELANADERQLWLRFGVAQFKNDDPRLKKIQTETSISETSKRITGDRS